MKLDQVVMMQDRWIDLKNRHMWIHGANLDPSDEEPGVEHLMATVVIKNLHALRLDNASKPIIVHLHTCGGVWEEGMAIYDAIKSMPYHVTMVNYTHARSMSSIIFQAADYRIMMPNSYFLFHRGTISMDNEWTTAKSNFEWSSKTVKTMIDIYVESARESKKFNKMSDNKIRSYLSKQMDKKSDVFLTPEEAIEWGFADAILENWDDL